jgi:YidC/Oxa1 family membrane protein insertase
LDFISKPIGLLLRSLYELTGNYGYTILLFALAAKIALFYFAYKGKRGMLQQQRMQPKIQELAKKYGKDKQKLQMEQAKLYQTEGISMFGGCLWMLAPFPVIIALFGAVRRPLEYIWGLERAAVENIAKALNVDIKNFTYDLEVANMLRSKGGEIVNAEHFATAQGIAPDIAELAAKTPLNFEFLGLNLAQVPSFTSALVIIPLLSAFASFMSMWLTQKFSKRPMAGGNTAFMMYAIGPGFSLWIGFTWPAVMGVYWIAQSIFQIPQEYFLASYWNNKLDAEEAAKARRAEIRKIAEAAQKEEDRQRRSERIEAQNRKHKPKRYKLQGKQAPKYPDNSQKSVPAEDAEDDE